MQTVLCRIEPVAARSRLRRPAAGFSLVEVTLALAVFALAIVALIGIFPTALSTSRLGRSETHMAQIGRAVLSDLRGFPFDKARLTTGLDASGVPVYNAPFSLAQAKTLYLLYGLDSAGRDARPLGETSAGDYASGVSGRGANYIVLVDLKPVTGSTGLTQVEVSVESPAAAKQAGRNASRIVTLVTQ